MMTAIQLYASADGGETWAKKATIATGGDWKRDL